MSRDLNSGRKPMLRMSGGREFRVEEPADSSAPQAGGQNEVDGERIQREQDGVLIWNISDT